MKLLSLRILAISLLLATFTISACKKNELRKDPVINDPFFALNHDDSNTDAPNLPANQYEGAVRFTASQMIQYQGKELIEVYYYIKDKPTACRIKVYSSGTGDPDSLLYVATVTNEVIEKAWNHHLMTSPVELGSFDLWIAVEFSTNQEQRTLGCDRGPAINNGDWLWDSADGQWTPLSIRSSIDINWNIRGVVDTR